MEMRNDTNITIAELHIILDVIETAEEKNILFFKRKRIEWAEENRVLKRRGLYRLQQGIK